MIKLNNINSDFFRKHKKAIFSLVAPLCATICFTACSEEKVEDESRDIYLVNNRGETLVIEDITNKYPYCNDGKYTAENLKHSHFKDVFTGELYTSGIYGECYNISGDVVSVDHEVENILTDNAVSITEYMTEEEITKLETDKLSDEELKKIALNAKDEYESDPEHDKPHHYTLYY